MKQLVKVSVLPVLTYVFLAACSNVQTAYWLSDDKATKSINAKLLRVK